MSRTLQDQVIDDDESETCPLCIEEFDLSDKNFHPCPCGYQICQFCYKNIRTEHNGQCPACRRVYEDKNIQWKTPSPEELAMHKENAQQQAKKKQAAKQKEAAKREADSLSRKHLSGIRVRQKNLVYVTGMKPIMKSEDLGDILRRNEFFGQYGDIVKVVVSNPKNNSPNAPVGVYVTFANKEDAAKCIRYVDGTVNQGCHLRAQYGTTKYCSAYLRGETCPNKSCMFLHEPGDENESFSRQDLSSMNVIHTQSPSQTNMAPHSPQLPQPQPPPQQAPQSIAATSRPEEHGQDDRSAAQETDTSALPSTASWANRGFAGRRESETQGAVGGTANHQDQDGSPGLYQPPPATSAASKSISRQETNDDLHAESDWQRLPPEPRKMPSLSSLIIQAAGSETFRFVFNDDELTEDERKLLEAYPLLFDPDGAARRDLKRKQDAERSMREKDGQVAAQALSAVDLDETAEGGSLQLGGEPEERQELNLENRQQHNAIQPPPLDNVSSPIFGQESAFSPTTNANPPLNGRGMTPQQQHFLLQQFKSSSPNPMNPQRSAQQLGPPHSGNMAHNRQGSRYSFANETSASATVKPVANPKLMNQQSSMMPSHSSQFNPSTQAPSGNQFFSSGIQGPPPGLKATGTPPVSGGGMFGQGHGFATAGLGYGANASNRNANDEMMRELYRSRNGSVGSGQLSSDAGRREYMFPSALHNGSQSSSPAPNPGLWSFPYGPQPGAFQDHGPQKQKKRGKKHRHANTSSSGGGVVDLADPSILHAQRMHQANAGQGPYGAHNQGQGFPTSTPFNAPIGGADSHMTDVFNTGPTWTSLMNVPPGFGAGSGQVESFGHLFASRQGIQDETPVMPGLGNVPLMTGPSDGKSDEGAPFTRIPEVPTGPSKGREAQQSTSTKQPTGKKPPGSQITPQNNEESFPALPKASAPPPSQPAAHPIVAIKKPKDKAKKESSTSKPASGEASKVADSKPAQTEQQQAQDTDVKSKQPSKLDIAAATSKESNQDQFTEFKPSSSKADTPKSAKDTSESSSAVSRSGTPGLPLDTPGKRGARTIRVTGGPNSQTTTSQPTTATPISAQASGIKSSVPPGPKSTSQQASRQPSVTSITIPETPASEKQSEVASVTTESASRANSPPPTSRIGSAPVREKSKSKQKKERTQRAKSLVEETTSAEPEVSESTAEAVVHEPIVVRKRKSKKPAPPSSTSTAEAGTSQAAAEDTNQAEPNIMEPIPEKKAEEAPTPKRTETKKVEPAKAEPSKAEPSKTETKKAETKKAETKKAETKKAETKKAETKKAEPSKAEAPKAESAATTKPTFSGLSEPSKENSKPASLLTTILNHLQSVGELTPTTNKLLKSSPPPTCRGEINTADLTFPPSYAPLTEAELSLLNSQKPVRRNGWANDQINNRENRDSPSHAASRLLITPRSRLCVRGLPKDLEDRILELEERLHNTPSSARFYARSVRDRTGGPAKYGGRKTAQTTRKVEHLIRDITSAYAELESQTAGAAAAAAAAAMEALRKSDERKAKIAAGEAVPESPAAKTPRPPPPSYADDALAYLNQFILPQPPPPPPPAQAPTTTTSKQQATPEGTGTTSTGPSNSTFKPTATTTTTITTTQQPSSYTPTHSSEPPTLYPFPSQTEQEPFPTASGPPTNPNLTNAAAVEDIGVAIPRTYTTGDPTFSVSGVDISSHNFYATAQQQAAVYHANAAAAEEEGQVEDEERLMTVDEERRIAREEARVASEEDVREIAEDHHYMEEAAELHARMVASGRRVAPNEEAARKITAFEAKKRAEEWQANELARGDQEQYSIPGALHRGAAQAFWESESAGAAKNNNQTFDDDDDESEEEDEETAAGSTYYNTTTDDPSISFDNTRPSESYSTTNAGPSTSLNTVTGDPSNNSTANFTHSQIMQEMEGMTRLDRYEAIKAMHARELEDALAGARREAREMERKLAVLTGGVADGGSSSKVVQLSKKVAVKFGKFVTIHEANAQRRARELVNSDLVHVPEVFHFFTDQDGIGYIMMEFVVGRITASPDDEHIKKIAMIMRHFSSIQGGQVGPLGGGPASAVLFEETDSPTFDSIESVEAWFNDRLLPHEDKLNLTGMPSSLCHLDVAPRNILWHMNGGVSLIDWASAGFYPSLFEHCAQKLGGQDIEFSDRLLRYLEPLGPEEKLQSQQVLRAWSNSQRYKL
ncbi:MAG: transcriptional repressor general negative regulator of transcription subunit 4 [Alyxoria varia]|nr:MAG: transcriptional repressor general negative regulator of transcription subunit 4 [Alyxoria varia]